MHTSISILWLYEVVNISNCSKLISTLCLLALIIATSKAFLDISIAEIFALLSSFARVTAIDPDPVQISKIFWPGILPNIDKTILINVSVSARGIKTSLFTIKLLP